MDQPDDVCFVTHSLPLERKKIPYTGTDHLRGVQTDILSQDILTPTLIIASNVGTGKQSKVDLGNRSINRLVCYCCKNTIFLYGYCHFSATAILLPFTAKSEYSGCPTMSVESGRRQFIRAVNTELFYSLTLLCRHVSETLTPVQS